MDILRWVADKIPGDAASFNLPKAFVTVLRRKV
jgi:hypothetical protein